MFQHMSINKLLAICIAVPLIGVFVFCSLYLSQVVEQYFEAKNIIKLQQAAIYGAELTHALQTEGGASIALAGGAKNEADVQQFRLDTDRTFTNFEESLTSLESGSNFEKAGVTIIERKKVLAQTRLLVDQGKANADIVVGAYQPLVLDLIGAIGQLSKDVSNADFSARIKTLSILLYGKERGAVEQSLGTALVSMREIVPELFHIFELGVHQQTAYFDLFISSGPLNVVAQYQELANSEIYKNLAKMRAEILSLPFGGEITFDLSEWLGATQVRANAYRNLQINATQDLSQEAETLLSQSQSKAIFISLIALFILVLGAYLSVMVGRTVLKQIEKLSKYMEDIREQKLDTEVSGKERADCIGIMARSIDQFRCNAIEMADMQKEKERENKEKEKLRLALTDRVNHFCSTIGISFDSIRQAGEDANNSSNEMKGQSQTARTTSSRVSEAANEATRNLSTVACAVEQLSNSIREISSQVANSSHVAEQSNQLAQNMRLTMDKLVKDAEGAGEIIEMINMIANQTNLLALNATVEAARAGDAGKGFAVVASEVKNLAKATGKATANVSERLNAVQIAVHEMQDNMEDTFNIVSQINEMNASVAAAVEEQNAATAEISGSIGSVSEQTTEVTVNIDQLGKAVSEVADLVNQSVMILQSLFESLGLADTETQSFATDVDHLIKEPQTDKRSSDVSLSA